MLGHNEFTAFYQMPLLQLLDPVWLMISVSFNDTVFDQSESKVYTVNNLQMMCDRSPKQTKPALVKTMRQTYTFYGRYFVEHLWSAWVIMYWLQILWLHINHYNIIPVLHALHTPSYFIDNPDGSKSQSLIHLRINILQWRHNLIKIYGNICYWPANKPKW